MNVDPSRPMSTCVHQTPFTWPVFPGLLIFRCSSESMLNNNQRTKNLGGLGMRLHALLQVHEKKFHLDLSNLLSLVVDRLICDPKLRLGKNGIEDFKRHPFFHDMEWENIRNTKPPFIPEYSSPTDTRNFEPIEEEEAVPRRYHVRLSLRLCAVSQSVCLSLASGSLLLRQTWVQYQERMMTSFWSWRTSSCTLDEASSTQSVFAVKTQLCSWLHAICGRNFSGYMYSMHNLGTIWAPKS